MIDSYFEIGSSHLICQDYVLHGTDGKMSYGIVSDGCSSAEYSEIGAQILCHVAKYVLILYYRAGLFEECSDQTLARLLGNSILKRTKEIGKLYAISPLSLQATLLIFVKIENEFYVFVWGDGVIIKRTKTDDIEVIKIDYPENTPFYLVTDQKEYLQSFANKKIEPKVTHEEMFFSKGTMQKTINEFDFFSPYIFNTEYAEDFTSLTICSDGILSYRDLNKNPIDILEVVPQFINFKSTTGEFVKKRMSFFKKSIQGKWNHYDDVAVSTILIGKNNG